MAGRRFRFGIHKAMLHDKISLVKKFIFPTPAKEGQTESITGGTNTPARKGTTLQTRTLTWPERQTCVQPVQRQNGPLGPRNPDTHTSLHVYPV